MMTFDVVIMGHVTVDVNVLPWGVVENALGGAPTYAGLALVALRRSVGVVSKVGSDFVEKFPPIYSKLGLDTEGIMVAGQHTTTFENRYDEAGNRTQKCPHRAPAITPDDIPSDYFEAKSFYISPIANEIGPEVLKAVKKKSNVVMLDPQGILREFQSDDRVEVKPRDLNEYLKYADIVKIGKEEAKILKGDVDKALESIKAAGPKVVIVTRGGEPTTVLSDEGLLKINPLKVDAKDMTGAGDVHGAAFLARYCSTLDVAGSARFATAAAGLKVRYRGPIGFPSEKDILNVISQLK
jgi:sugar/nucleoside kinase (ribokinase family)